MKFWRYYPYAFFIIFSLLAITARGQQSYYVSSLHGNDNNLGTSTQSPWKSLTKLQAVLPSLGPGSKIYLEKGSEWFNAALIFNNVKGSAASPILITSYGSGKAPVIKGSLPVGSFSNSGTLWTCYNSQFPTIDADLQVIAGVYLNDEMLPISRMPNSGFYSTGTRGDGTYLEDAANNWSNNQWQGGQVVGRTASWAWDKSYITYNNAQAFGLEGLYYGLTKDKTFYYIQNHTNAADQEGEWAYRNQTLTIRSSLNLAQQKVEIPVSRKLLQLTSCEYIKFTGIHFSRSNQTGISIQQGNSIEFDNCRFSNMGSEALYVSGGANFYLRNSIVEDCFSIGLKMDDVGFARVENNKFRRIGIFPGLSNGHTRVGSTISCYRAKEPIYFQHNRFDSIMNAYQGHFSSASTYFQYNLIEDYGMTLGDYGAVYLEGESMSEVKKYVKNNIFISGHASLDSYEMRGGDAYPQAIYLDYDCTNVLLDSNTIIDCNVAFFYNRVINNTAQNNIVYNPGVNMVSAWKSALSWDATTGLQFNSFDRNKLLNNEFVLTHKDDKGVILTGFSVLENVMDYNRWIFPFRSDGDIIAVVENYYIAQAYNISEWTAATGLSAHSAYGASSTKYNSSLGVSEEDFVKVIYNASSATKTFNLGASYADKNGTLYDHSVTLPPWYSKVLYYHGVSQYQNSPPSIAAQTFVVDARPPVNTYIGKVVATDPDADQTLKYSITGGNVNNAFSINQSTGALYLNLSLIDVATSANITLKVTVSDNVATPLSAAASIYINFANQPVNEPPVIQNQTFTVKYEDNLPSLIGQIVASDPDPGQTLNYVIQSGNQANYFNLIASTGKLYFKNELIVIPDGTYSLTVRVTDNGTPALSDDAVITIKLEHQVSTNLAPLITNQSFTYLIENGGSLDIGRVIASDPDGDPLSYKILSSETDAIEIVENTGLLRFSYEITEPSDILVYNLLIEVSDNKTPSLSSSAEVRVEIIPYNFVVYIDPSSESYGTGTRENPLNSIDGITLETDHLYLIRRNTELIISDAIVIDEDNISIQAYGDGENLPIIRSINRQNLLKIMDRNAVIISDLNLRADSAVSGVYIVGPNSHNITIRNCKIEGAEYGIRLINTGTVLIKNNQLSSNHYGIYSISGNMEMQYNIISDSYIGLNLLGSEGSANVFNNVFYRNELALYSELASLNLYNNVFFHYYPTDKAVVSMYGIVSDYNIYYPQTSSYYMVEGVAYNDISELRLALNQDINSHIIDPEFGNASVGDFSLSEGSPAIDKGLFLGIATDILGNPIPFGKAPDIGVIEKIGMTSNPKAESDNQQEIRVFPNPANEYIQLQYTGFKAGTYTLEVIDILGKTIMSERQYIDDYIRGSLEIASLEGGMYLIRIRAGDRISAIRFMKLD